MPATHTPDTIALEAIGALGRLTDRVQQRREQLAVAVGLTVAQWRVLEEISDEHFMPSLFARQRDSSRASVSKILRQLQDKQLVSAAVSPVDGRQRHYTLTPTGRASLDRLRELRRDAINEIWLGLDTEQTAAFIRYSEELIQRMEAYAEKQTEGYHDG